MKRKSRVCAKALTPGEIDRLCEELRQKDFVYAQKLDARIGEFLSRKKCIRDYGELKLVNDLKRVLLGLHDKLEIQGGLEIAIIKKVIKVDKT